MSRFLVPLVAALSFTTLASSISRAEDKEAVAKPAGAGEKGKVVIATNFRSSELIGANWDRVKVRHLMTRPAVTVHLATTITRAARLMLDEHIHRVVVVDEEGAPVGVLTATDLLRALLPEEEAARLPGE